MKSLVIILKPDQVEHCNLTEGDALIVTRVVDEERKRLRGYTGSYKTGSKILTLYSMSDIINTFMEMDKD